VSGHASGRGEGGRSGTPLAQKLGLMRSGRAVVVSGSASGGGGSRGSVAEGAGAGSRVAGVGRRMRSSDRVGGKSQGRSRQDDGSSESVRGLTEGVILHTTDYAVEYEDHEMVNMGRDGSTASSGVDGGGVVRTRS
jgi:hypothetical protein